MKMRFTVPDSMPMRSCSTTDHAWQLDCLTNEFSEFVRGEKHGKRVRRAVLVRYVAVRNPSNVSLSFEGVVSAADLS